MWNLLCQYNNIYKRKKKVQTEDEKKKTLGTIATVLPGTVATFQKKKKRKKSDSPKLHCR